MIKNLKRLLPVLFLSVMISPSMASNYNFLNNTAMTYFTQEDWQLFNKTQMRVLNQVKDGVKVNWKNPHSGSYGYMIASSTSRQQGTVCRTLSFYNNAHHIDGQVSYRFCKKHNQWSMMTLN